MIAPTQLFTAVAKRKSHTRLCFGIAFFACAVVSESLANSRVPQKTVEDVAPSQKKLLAELRDLQKKSTQGASIEATFEQRTYSALRKKITTSNGTLQFSQPRMFRWEVTSPRAELYVNNDKWFWKYVASTKHALRMPATSNELQFLDVIFNFEALPDKFIVSKIRKIPTNELNISVDCDRRYSCFELSPQSQERHRQITIAIDKESGYAKSVYIEFRNGNKTEISFSQYKQSQFSKRNFDFSPPPGTAIDKR